LSDRRARIVSPSVLRPDRAEVTEQHPFIEQDRHSRLAAAAAREEQQLRDRADRLRLPRAPATDEIMRLTRSDPAAALALLNDFDRAREKTVGRLLDEKARALLDSGEYGDPDDFYRVVGELPDGGVEVECDVPGAAEDDAEEWLRELRPDLYEQFSRVLHLAVKVARITRAPSRVREVAERSPFSWQLRVGLAARRCDRRRSVRRVGARPRGAGRPRGRSAARARGGDSGDNSSDLASDSDGEPPAGASLGGARECAA
jgi:hypothetical protein